MEIESREWRPFGDGTDRAIAAMIEVHRHLGPGLMESAYEAALCRELDLNGIAYERQIPLPVEYKGMPLDCGYRLDLLIERTIVVELKTVERLLLVDEAQALTYLRLSGADVVLLANFNSRHLRDGLRRLVRRAAR
jgi:GxxExxY protein